MTNQDNATTLILLRHGETEWNLSGRWQGQAMDTDLSDRGREQARIVARRLQAYPFGAIYSSDLKRAWDTACIVGDQVGMQPVADVALRESDIGVWTGMTWDEILTRFPDEMAAMMAGEDIRRGGGESMSELTSRLAAAVERIAAAHPGETVLLVSHGAALRSIVAHALQASLPQMQRIAIGGNTAISVLRVNDGRMRLVSYNDTAHLDGGAAFRIANAEGDQSSGGTQ